MKHWVASWLQAVVGVALVAAGAYGQVLVYRYYSCYGCDDMLPVMPLIVGLVGFISLVSPVLMFGPLPRVAGDEVMA